MSRNKGTFNFAANFEVLNKAPLDARNMVNTLSSLTDPSSWMDVEGNVWLYKGLVVSVSNDPSVNNNGLYFLTDETQYTSLNYWSKIVQTEFINDVSGTKYLSFQLNNTSGGVILKDTSSNLSIIKQDGSLSNIYVNSLLSNSILINNNLINVIDLSINGLSQTDNAIATSSAIRSYVDKSIKTIDVSATTNSLGLIKIGNGFNIDASGLIQINSLADSSLLLYIDNSLNVRDTSLGNLSNWDYIQDLSISNLNSLQNNYVLKTGSTMTGSLILSGAGSNLTVDGSSLFYGNAVFFGKTYFDGSTYYTNVETIDISSGYIVLNTGLTGAPPLSLQSGIIVNRGTSDPYVFVYNESTQAFRIGISKDVSGYYSDSSTQAVATRQDTPVNNGLAIWNNNLSRFDTSTDLSFNNNTLTIDGSLNINKGIILSGINTSSSENTALMISSSGNVIKRTINTIDVSSINKDPSTDEQQIYAGNYNNTAYIKNINGGNGIEVTSDSSTITVSTSLYVAKKYSGTFDGSALTTINIEPSTHMLGAGPFVMSIYDNDQVVYIDMRCSSVGLVTFNWNAGTMSSNCKFIIIGCYEIQSKYSDLEQILKQI